MVQRLTLKHVLLLDDNARSLYANEPVLTPFFHSSFRLLDRLEGEKRATRSLLRTWYGWRL